jgi:hypothetical protein
MTGDSAELVAAMMRSRVYDHSDEYRKIDKLSKVARIKKCERLLGI